MQTDWERFRDAVLVLAGGGPVKQRLAEAYQGHLRDIDPEDLPRDLRGPYTALVGALQSGQRAGSLGVVPASILKMSEADATRHAQTIVHLFAGLHEPQPVARATTVLRSVPTDDEIPAFLNRA